jgi:RNase P subunit RPR2
MSIPTHCRNCNGPLVEATSASTDSATLEMIRKRQGVLRVTPTHRPVAYICKSCGKVYFFAKERDI